MSRHSPPPRRSLHRTLWRRLQRWAFTSAAVALCIISYGYSAPRPPTIDYTARFAEHATAVQTPPPGAIDAGPLLQSLAEEAQTFADAIFKPVRDQLQQDATTAEEAIALNSFYFDWELLYFTDGADPRAVALVDDIYEKLAATGFFERTRPLVGAQLFTFDDKGAAYGLSGFVSHADQLRRFVRLQVGRLAKSHTAGDDANYLAALREGLACVRAVRGQARITEDLLQSALSSELTRQIIADLRSWKLSTATHREALNAVAAMPALPLPSQILKGERLHSRMLLQELTLQARASFWGRVNEGLGFRKKQTKRADQMYDRLEPLVDLPRSDRVARGLAPTGLAAVAQDEGIVVRKIGPGIERWRETRDRTTCTARGELLHIAIELYRAEHEGNPPPTLDALVPGFLPSIPKDPFAADGRFRYRPLNPTEDPHGRAYLLYSVGPDMIDNDGTEPAEGATIPGRFFGRPSEIDADAFNSPGFDFVFNMPVR